MNRIILLVFLSGVIYTTQALECFQCTNCKDPSDNKEQCLALNDACIKVEVGDLVARSCGNKIVCSLTDSEKQSNNIWQQTMELIKGEKDDDDEKSVHCCEGDLCNGASSLFSRVTLLSVLVVMGAWV